MPRHSMLKSTMLVHTEITNIFRPKTLNRPTRNECWRSATLSRRNSDWHGFMSRGPRNDLNDAEQIVGRERSQRVSYRELVRNVVARRRVNSNVMRLMPTCHEKHDKHAILH